MRFLYESDPGDGRGGWLRALLLLAILVVLAILTAEGIVRDWLLR